MMNIFRSRTSARAFAFLTIFSPILFFCIIAWRYCVDVPWFDDFEVFPIFLDHWLNTDSVWDKWLEIIRPNNEHRMVSGKLAVVVYYLFTKTLNFRFLQAIGICFTLGTFTIFYKAIQRAGLSLWYLLPVSLLLFQFEHYLVYGWSICGLQHQPVIFFITLSSYFLAWRYFYWAILAAICANFSMSNGILVWVVGGGILMLQQEYKKLGFWLLTGILMAYLYLHDIPVMGNESSVPYIIQHPVLTTLGFFTFLGGIFDVLPTLPLNYRIILPIVTGVLGTIIITVWWLKLLRKWLKNQQLSNVNLELTYFIFGISIFLIVNALIIAFLRPRFGFFVMLVSNYKLYPALFLVVIYVVFLCSPSLQKFKKINLIGAAFVSFSIWLLSAFHSVNTFSERRKTLVISAYNQKINGTGLGLSPNTYLSLYIDSVMNVLANKNIYHYPTIYKPIVEAIDKAGNTKFYNLPMIQNTEKSLTIVQQGKFHFDEFNGGIYVYFKSRYNLYVFKMDPVQYQGKNIFRTYRDVAQFTIDDYSNTFLSGNYLMGFIKVENNAIQAGQYGAISIPKFK